MLTAVLSYTFKRAVYVVYCVSGVKARYDAGDKALAFFEQAPSPEAFQKLSQALTRLPPEERLGRVIYALALSSDFYETNEAGTMENVPAGLIALIKTLSESTRQQPTLIAIELFTQQNELGNIDNAQLDHSLTEAILGLPPEERWMPTSDFINIAYGRAEADKISARPYIERLIQALPKNVQMLVRNHALVLGFIPETTPSAAQADLN